MLKEFIQNYKFNIMNSKYKDLKKASMFIGVLILLILILVFSVLIAVTIGSTSIKIKDVYSVILFEAFNIKELSEYSKGAIHDVIWLIRLPRLVLGVAVGAGLAVAGAVMQAVVKNPMASPYTLGVSSGASLGATMAILMSIGAKFGNNSVGILAFLGALLATFLVMLISNIKSKATTTKLLLSGMAVSSIFAAFSSFIIFFAHDKEGIKNITYWLMGSLGGAKWESIGIIYLVVTLGSLFFINQWRTLNLMLLGDDVSITLGTNLHRTRQIYMIVTSLMVGFVVFSAGIIGFVGLIIPHIARLFFGSNHKKVIPICFLFGGIFLVWADVLSRVIIPYTELPIGILVSMIGSPTFIFLMVRKSTKVRGNI